MKKLMILAGDSGVYVGMVEGGVEGVPADGRVVVYDSRHLRRYYVAGRTGDGSASDLAAKGIDPDGSSISDVVAETVLLGVRRAFVCSDVAAATFAGLK